MSSFAGRHNLTPAQLTIGSEIVGVLGVFGRLRGRLFKVLAKVVGVVRRGRDPIEINIENGIVCG
jgi:hypothetical protein